MLHKTCGSRLKQQYVCPKDGTIVERADIAKGYEFAKGQYVLFIGRRAEGAAGASRRRRSRSREFVPTAKVDPIYFEKSYYLGPDKGGDRAYKLLAKAIAKSGRSALAKLRGARQAVPGAAAAVRGRAW